MMRPRNEPVVVAGLLLAVLLGASRPGFASCDVIVDAAGRGSYTSIQAAVDDLPTQGPCRVEVRAGTYHESVIIAGKNQQADGEDDRILFVADRGAVVAADADHAFVIAGGRFLTIDGFTITTSRREAIALEGGTLASTDVTLSRNDIHNNGLGPAGGGILVAPRNDRVWIVNNLIRSNGRNGITLQSAPRDGTAVYVVNNTILSNGWNGISIGPGREVYAINNLVMGNGVDGGTAGGRWGLVSEGGTGRDESDLVTLKSNIFYRNGSRAPASSGGDIFEPAQVLDQTDTGNVTTSGQEGSGISECAVPGCIGAPMSAFFGGTGFGPDFHVVPGAPGISHGAGTFVHHGRDWIPDVDVDGEKRDRSRGVEIGCDQLSDQRH